MDINGKPFFEILSPMSWSIYLMSSYWPVYVVPGTAQTRTVFSSTKRWGFNKEMAWVMLAGSLPRSLSSWGFATFSFYLQYLIRPRWIALRFLLKWAPTRTSPRLRGLGCDTSATCHAQNPGNLLVAAFSPAQWAINYSCRVQLKPSYS
jgi:hypothetical protein